VSYLELTSNDPLGSGLTDRGRKVLASSGVVHPIYGRVGSGFTDLYRELGATETPDIKPLPWDLQPSEDELKRVARAETWNKVNTFLGIAGGALGLILSYNAVMQLVRSRK